MYSNINKISKKRKKIGELKKDFFLYPQENASVKEFIFTKKESSFFNLIPDRSKNSNQNTVKYNIK